ncbi:MAG: hypothetical protein IJB53_11690 [Mailhella sp.]|nr:hypothetical protein [Mailhella sp.]
MPPISNQIKLDFENLTKAGLKNLLKVFEKQQCPVASVDAPNKSKRESGMLTKSFTLTFEDGQNLQIRVKADGTVYQVRLNNKVMPIKHVDDLDKAVTEMIDYVQDNAKAYERAKIQREKRKIRVPKPAVLTSRKEKIAQAKEELDQLDASNTALEQQKAELDAAMSDKSGQLERVMRDLDAEKAKTEKLEATLAALQKNGE